MRIRRHTWVTLLAISVLNAALLTPSWADDPAKTPPPAKQTSPKNSDSSGGKMDCDMKDKDMSKMSAEEHKKMMEKCKAHHQDTEHGDHSHEGKEHT